jgi:hypothetical protein
MEKDSKLAIFVYIVFAFLILLPLLKPGYYLALDMQAGPYSYSDIRFGDFYGETPSSYGAYFPPKMVLAAVSDIIGTEAVEKLRLFLIVLLCGISAHFSLPKEHGSARYLAGLLYMLNPFVFVRFLAGHGSLLLSYAFWPLALMCFSQFLDKPNSRRPLVKTALFVTLAAASSHGVIILLICFALMLLFHLLKTGIRGPGMQFAKRLALLAAIILALNLYWIAPTIILFGSTHTPASPEAYLEDFKPLPMGMPVVASLLTMHGFWRGGFYYTKDILPYWYVPFILMAAISAIGFLSLLGKKRESAFYALFLLSLLVVGLLLALGEESPISFLFTIFGKQIPIHMIFRDSQKFVGMICLSLSMLGSFGASHLMRTYPKWSLAVLALILLLPVIYDFGIFGFFGQIRPTQYPADWVEAGKIISADPTETRILVLPPYLYNTYKWSNATQKTLASPANHFFSKPIIVSQSVMTSHVYSDVKDTYGGYVQRIFKNRQYINNTAELLVPINARYILILKDYRDSDSYLWLFHRKGGVKDITLVYESDSLYLFRNELVFGPILASAEGGNGGFKSLARINVSGLSDNVTYTHVNPATYEITGCGGPYLFYASPADPFSEFSGIPPQPWNGIASTYPCSGPGVFGNRVFPVSLALFLLSWVLAISLLARPGIRGIIILAISSVLAYALIWFGILGPHHIGALLALSMGGSLAVFNYDMLGKPYTSFLKLN